MLCACHATPLKFSADVKSIEHAMHMSYRTSAALPSMRRPGAIRALRLHGYACHGTDAALIDQ